MLFSHNKSVGTVFRLVFSAKRTGPRTRQVHFMQGSARQRVRLPRIWAKCQSLPPICAYTTKPQQQSEFTRSLSKFHAAKHRLRTLLLCHSLTLPQLSTHRELYCHSLNTVTEWIGYIANGFSWYRLYMQHMATSWCLIQTLAQASEKETLKQSVPIWWKGHASILNCWPL